MAQATRPGENTTKDKIRLPLWAWALIAGGGVILAYRFYQARQAQNAANANSTASGTSASQQQDYSLIPVPVATQTGNTPADEQNYQNLLNAIQALQGSGAAGMQGGNPPSQGIGVPTTANPTIQPNGSPRCVTQIPYAVQQGDTLASISAKFGTSAAQVSANNSNPYADPADGQSPGGMNELGGVPSAVQQAFRTSNGTVHQGQQLYIPWNWCRTVKVPGAFTTSATAGGS